MSGTRQSGSVPTTSSKLPPKTAYQGKYVVPSNAPLHPDPQLQPFPHLDPNNHPNHNLYLHPSLNPSFSKQFHYQHNEIPTTHSRVAVPLPIPVPSTSAPVGPQTPSGISIPAPSTSTPVGIQNPLALLQVKIMLAPLLRPLCLL